MAKLKEKKNEEMVKKEDGVELITRGWWFTCKSLFMKESEIVRRDNSLQQRRTHKFARGDTFTSLE